MSLSIPQKFITDLENFTWSDDWRATRIIKEKRSDGEYFFARIIRFYGEKEDTHDYDIGNTLDETAWLGRSEKFVGKRTHDRDPDSPTFGKRIYNEAITETITEPDSKGRPIERVVLVEGKTIYQYSLPVNAENIKKLKTLVGAVELNRETQFLFVYGINTPYSVTADTFWSVSVGEYFDQAQELIIKKNAKKV